MTFWTFILLISCFFWLAIMHVLNSPSHAGELARTFVRGVIERLVGNRKELPTDSGKESEAS